MGEIVTISEQPSLMQLAEEINTIHTVSIIGTGNRLLQARDQLPYGKLGSWIRANCPFTVRQANTYMLIASRKDELPEKIGSIRKALKLLEDIDIRKAEELQQRVVLQIGSTASNLNQAEKTEPPSAAKVLDEVAGRIVKYNWGVDIDKMKKLIKHREQYSPQLWSAAKGAIQRSIQSLTDILKEMENE